MRKKGLLFSILLLVAIVFGQVRVNAAVVGGLYGATATTGGSTTLVESDDPTKMFGGSITISNANADTKFYIGVKAIEELAEGKVISATMNFTNSDFVFKKCSSQSSSRYGVNCTKVDSTHVKIEVTLKRAITKGSNAIVAEISLDGTGASESTKDCVITLSNVGSETPVTPKCKVVDGKYYNDKGVEVTKEEYDKACTSTNPETGAFLPIAVIGLGVAVVVGLFFATKNNKMYQV